MSAACPHEDEQAKNPPQDSAMSAEALSHVEARLAELGSSETRSRARPLQIIVFDVE